MEQIKKLENQIKALNKRLQEGKVKNVYSGGFGLRGLEH